MTPSVIIEEIIAKKGKIGVLELNRPDSLNSLTLEMVDSIDQQLTSWNNDDDLAVVVLKARGDKAFCAGADIQQLYESTIKTPGGPCKYAESFFLEEYALDYKIHQYNKPIVCIGSGITMGGGLGLMMGASHRLVTPSSLVAMPEITIGLFPDVGGTYFLSRIPYNLGFFLGLTGASLNASDALFANLADACIAIESIEQLEESMTQQTWDQTPDNNHKLLNELLTPYVIDAKQLERDIPSQLKRHLPALENTCQAHSLAEMIHSLEGLSIDDDWINTAVSNLQKGSPLSSILIYEQLKRHRNDTLKDVFLSEYQLATNIIRYPEFTEGVRALLIDKDKSPKWNFEHFSAVPSSLIEQMFSPPWKKNKLDKRLGD